jgi:hypothetical protein
MQQQELNEVFTHSPEKNTGIPAENHSTNRPATGLLPQGNIGYVGSGHY